MGMRINQQSIPIIVLAAAALLVFGAFVVVNLTNPGADGDIVQTEESSGGAPSTAEATEPAPDEATPEASMQADSTDESEAAAQGTPTPTSLSRVTRSILIGTAITPMLQTTAVPQGGTTTPTSLSRVTRSIILGAEATETAEATTEVTEAAHGATGGTLPPPDSGLPFAGRDDVSSTLQPQGPVAARQAALWWIMLGIGGVIYLAVMVFVLRIVGKRRREREYRPSNRKVLGLIVGGGVILPMIVLTALFALTLGTMAVLALDDTPTELTVEVTGFRWWWEVRYPDQGFVTANEIHIPIGQPVRFSLASADVIHSFWVPELGGKMDLLPGQTNAFWLQADTPGEYRGQCAEFCGRQHANMAILVIAHEREDFEAWVANQQQAARDPTDELIARGQEVFLNSACIACHAVAGTTAQGIQGPNLTHFGSRRWIGAGAVPNTDAYLGQWIVNSQVLKPGNLMPPQDIPAEDIPALVAYLHSLD